MRNPGTQRVVKAIVYTIVIAALVIGVFALLTFDPATFFAAE